MSDLDPHNQPAGGNRICPVGFQVDGVGGQPARALFKIGVAACCTAATDAASAPYFVDRLVAHEARVPCSDPSAVSAVPSSELRLSSASQITSRGL